MKMRPLNDWVIFRIELEKHEGVIQLPETCTPEAKRIATVEGVGSKCTQVRVGDKIVLPKYIGEPAGEQNLYSIQEKDILMVIEDET